MKHAIPMLLAALLLAACAGPGAQQKVPAGSVTLSQAAAKKLKEEGSIVAHVNPGLAKEEDIVCRQEDIMGSHRKRVVCMSREEREKIAEETQKTLEWGRERAASKILNRGNGR